MSHIRNDVGSAVDIFAVIVAILLIAAGVMAVLLYAHMTAPVHKSLDIPVVEEGDEVEFTYTGYFENKVVFETLDLDVAIDNDTYPKSLLFTWPEDGNFDPVTLTVGNGIPHKNFEGMKDHGSILENAILGLHVNESVTVTVLPEDGFGEHDESLIRTLNLTETIYQIEVLSSEEFGERFKAIATVNATFTDPVWGWEVKVLDAKNVGTDYEITIMNLPVEGELYSPYVGFESEVVSVESGANQGRGEIVLRHILDPEDAGSVMGISPHGEGKFVVVGVDPADGTFLADFNSEKAGRILIYEITIVDIKKR